MQAAPETLREKLTRVNTELAQADRRDEFYTSLENSWNRYGSLTERQEQALIRSFARLEERAAQRAQENAAVTSPMPTGRVQIAGKIISTKWQDSRFGGAWKMLVKSDAGWKVWGTIPAGIESADNSSIRFEELGGRGLRVTFTATIEPKEPAFGFFSRPTNARLLGEAQPPKGQIVEDQAQVIQARPADIVCTNKSFFAPAGKLSDIIAKAKEIEARREAADLASGGLASEYWDTDSMTEARNQLEERNFRAREAEDDRRFERMAYGDRD